MDMSHGLLTIDMQIVYECSFLDITLVSRAIEN